MKRGKKTEKQKELLRLNSELRANWEAQRNLGYKPLEKPVPHGYDAYWTLRDDAARRSDADRMQHIIDTYGVSVWCRKKNFKVWDYTLKRETDLFPKFKELSIKDYENLKPWVKKFFVLSSKLDRWNNSHYFYKVHIPPHYLVRKIVRSYKTHYKVIDEILLQEQAEIEARLEYSFYNERNSFWGRSRTSKKLKKIYNKANRKYNKQTIQKNSQGYYQEDFEFKDMPERCWW